MKKILLLLTIIIASTYSHATHVIGGEINYTHMGGSSYLLTLKLYRDCDPGNFDFATSATIFHADGDGANQSSWVIPRVSRSVLNPPIDTCAFDPGICVEEGIFQGVVSMPPNTGGYHLWYEICCRNGSIDNVNDPLNEEEVFYTYVPDNNIWLTNSSPVITNFPPVFVCRGNDLNLDFGATDADGDSLSYSFYTPYDTDFGPNINAAGTPPDNITFDEIDWLGGLNVNFGPTDPLDPGAGILPGITIDQTGHISGIPPALGQYVVGVMVEEWRDGVKIGRITRDFQFNVIDCPPPQNAGIGALDACSGLSIDFINESGAGANGFWWDFGTGNPADTSVAFEPSFAYPSIGTYNVTLIAQKGTLCADTAYHTMTISGVNADYTSNLTACVDEPVSFTDLSVPAANATVNGWLYDFDDGSNSGLQNPTHSFSTAGSYDVEFVAYTDVGCTDTITYTITINEPPGAGITPLNGCNDLDVSFTNNSDVGATGFWWNFGTGNPADTSIVSNPSFTFPGYGVYTVSLVAQHNTFCADTATFNITVSSVTADFVGEDTVCTNVLVPYSDASFTSGGGTVNNWEWDFGGAGSSTQQNPNFGYTVPGDYDVELIAISNLGCRDTIIYPIHVMNAPIAQIGPTDFCAGLTIDFNNTSDPTAYGFHWDFGTGNPNDTSNVFEPTFTYPAYGNYTVTLTAQAGTSCQTQTTLPIVISDLTANFVANDTICQNDPIAFTDASVTQAGTTIINWDWDFGGTGASGQQNPTHTFMSPTSGTIPVTLIVESNIGCEDTVVMNIEVQSEPVPNAGLDTAVCVSNPSLQLNASVAGATGGTWQGGGGVFSPSANILNPTYFPSLAEMNAGSTQLILTTTGNGYCAAQTDTINVLYLDTPTINVASDIDVCDDTTYVQLNASVQFASNIQWNHNGTGNFDDPNSLNPIYTFGIGEVVAGDSVTFYIETFNFSGCPDDNDSIMLYFNAPPTMNMMFDDTICTGFPVVLNSNSSTGNGLWETTGDGVFSPDSNDVTSYLHGPGDESNGDVTIYFETLDNGGCNALYDTLNIVIVPSPTPSYGFTEDCFGLPTVFSDQSTSIDPIVNWDWTFESGQTSTSQDPNHTFTTPGDHNVQLIVTSQNGCKDTMVQVVRAHHIPVADFAIPAPCLQGGSFFYDSSYVVDDVIVSWAWTFGDGSGTFTSQHPIHQYASADIYTVSLTVESGFGCTDDTVVDIMIHGGPDAAFIYNPTTGINVGIPVQFTDQSTENDGQAIVAWDWSYNDTTFSFDQNPSHAFDPEGEYDVMLIVIDESGCRDTAINMVPVFHGPLVPSGFTPNGDGNNDYFMILGGNFESINFRIYNNWGEVIYETNDPESQGWDGTYAKTCKCGGGIEQPMGVYVYTAVVVTYDGVEHVLHGDVSLLR